MSFKKNAEAQARQKEIIENIHMEKQHDNADSSGKDSLPQESSTTQKNDKDNGKYCYKPGTFCQKLMLSFH